MNQYQFDAYRFKPILENVEEVKQVDAVQQIEVDPELLQSIYDLIPKFSPDKIVKMLRIDLALF